MPLARPRRARQRHVLRLPYSKLPEQALAFLIDHETPLAQRAVDGIIERGEAVGADEFVLLAHALDHLRNDARRLILAGFLEGGGLDHEAFVLDLLGDGGRSLAGLVGLAASAAEERFQE